MKVADPKELQDIIKNYLKRYTDSAVMLRITNHDLFSLRRERITPELNMTYKHFSFPPQG